MPAADLSLDPKVGLPHSKAPDKPCSQWLLGVRKAICLPVISLCPLGRHIGDNFSSTQIIRISIVAGQWWGSESRLLVKVLYSWAQALRVRMPGCDFYIVAAVSQEDPEWDGVNACQDLHPAGDRFGDCGVCM